MMIRNAHECKFYAAHKDFSAESTAKKNHIVENECVCAQSYFRVWLRCVTRMLVFGVLFEKKKLKFQEIEIKIDLLRAKRKNSSSSSSNSSHGGS